MPDLAVQQRWQERLLADRARADRNQSRAQRAVTAEVVRRSLRAGAVAVALTGSTARARRTAVSDVDYHVVGSRPDLEGLPGDVDVVADSRGRFDRRLSDGDDFIQWSLRHGCVLHDPEGVAPPTSGSRARGCGPTRCASSSGPPRSPTSPSECWGSRIATRARSMCARG